MEGIGRSFEPSYLRLHREGVLSQRIKDALEVLTECHLCPRGCAVNRLEGERGICKTARLAIVSSYNAHFGEEDPLVGTHGSGTIFFTHCNLLCVFCQNYDISHQGYGSEVGAEELANMMLALQSMGCHNINFVTPTHVVPQILEALPLAIEGGLKVPLVYNSGGYDLVESLRFLEGIFDIYMPDLKFMSPDVSEQLCKAPDYPHIVQAALKEMHRQVGDLVTDERGVAQRGLLVRHLVMPEGVAGTQEAMRFLATEISKDTYVNIMDQYRPCGEAHRYPSISRRPTAQEYGEALEAARKEGIHRLDRRKKYRIIRLF